METKPPTNSRQRGKEIFQIKYLPNFLKLSTGTTGLVKWTKLKFHNTESSGTTGHNSDNYLSFVSFFFLSTIFSSTTRVYYEAVQKRRRERKKKKNTYQSSSVRKRKPLSKQLVSQLWTRFHRKRRHLLEL